MQTQFANRITSNASWRMGLTALFVAMLTWLAVPQAAWAATFTVTKPADTNDGACNADCSLREAIIAANASPGADIITLSAGTYTLSRSGADNTAANGDLDVTDALTINGAAQATTIIQAGTSSSTAIDRLFSFNPLGSAVGFAVSLNNLTLRYGKNSNAFATQENDGGCFDFDAGTTGVGSLSLTNVTVTNCETTDGGGGGFVIYFPKGGTATLNNVTVQNNSATRPPASGGLGNGGGILVGGAGGSATLTINNSLIDNNRALKTTTTINSIGGGIAIGARSNPAIATNYQIHSTRITNNQAAGDGGGIHSLSPLTIDNVGGVALFSNNQAGNNGGGLFLRHPSQTTNISKVTFSGNRATNLGGGIRSSNGDAQTLNVSFSRFVNNTAATGKGSGLSSYTAVTTAANNWWGCSTGPAAAPCDTAQLDIDNTNPAGTLNFTPWLRLNLTAATNPLVTGQSTGLTASFLTNSNNGAVALSNLDVLLGLPVTWSNASGTLTGQQTTIQTGGTATANYQASAPTAGSQVVAKVDNDGTTTGANVLAITVNKANTTATITADTPDPSLVGQAVTVNFSVAVGSPGTGTPTGNVTVSDGVNSCTATVAAGTCTITLTTVGARTLTATYAGDANFNGSTSVGVAHTVNNPPTATPTATPVPPTATPTATPVPPTATPTETPVPPTETPTETPVPPTAIPTETPVPPTETPTETPVPPTETPTETPLPPTVTPAAAMITIALDTRPNTKSNLAFSGNLGRFLLDDPDSNDGDQVPNSKTFTVAPGSYTVSRSALNNWFITAIECSGGTPVVDLVNWSVTVTVAPNDVTSCTYIIEQSIVVRARAYADLVRNNNYLGQRNAGDPWQNGWPFTLYTAPGVSAATGTTQPINNIPEVRFLSLRAGSYTLCTTLPDANWQTTSPAAIDSAYGLPCKAVTAAPGQNVLLLFGAYNTSVVASAAITANEEVITDQEDISTLPDVVNEEVAAPTITTSVPVSTGVGVTAPVAVESPTVVQPQAPAPVDANPAPALDTAAPAQRIFLPIVANLAGTALGSPGGLALLALVMVVIVGLLWQRRRAKR